MNNTIVVYTSETGFTEKYACWIAEELKCKAVKRTETSKDELKKFDIIIYGGGICAGQINGLKKMKQMVQGMDHKQMVMFATGATPPDFTDTVKKALDQNFTEEEKKRIPAYYFQGGLNYERMSFKSKTLMKMFASMMAKKKDKTEEEKVMAEGLKCSSDMSRREWILPLVSYVRTLRSVD